MMSKLPTILLVDDDPATNFLNQRLLTRLQIGSEVLLARNGLEALTLLLARWHERASICPALILLDVDMPIMSGFEFLSLYTRLPPDQREALIVVTLTHSQLDEDSVRAQQWPVKDFLTKPLTRESVLYLLQRHFNYALPIG